MIELINLDTKQELSEVEFRVAHPNTSFGPVIDYASFGYAVVYPTPQPAHDPVIQTVRRLPAVLTDKGHYEQAWEVVPRFNDYTDENGVLHTRAEQEAEAIAKDAEEKAAHALAAAKDARQVEVDAITVTTQSGKVFDGNEDAQNRMGRAVTSMEPGDTIPWVLADNTVAVVGRDELKEALRLAGAAMAVIWVRPYQ